MIDDTMSTIGQPSSDCPIELCLTTADLKGWGIEPLADGVLAMTYPDDTTQLIFPAFQFIPDSRSSAFVLHPTVAVVNRALGEAGHLPSAILLWWYAVNVHLNGKQPRIALMYDEPELLLLRAAKLHLIAE